MESRISKRVGAIAPSATFAETSKAKELKAAGAPVIGFGAGEPDFPTPSYIVEAAVSSKYCSMPVSTPASIIPIPCQAVNLNH